MLLKLSDVELIGKYLEKIKENQYRTKDNIFIPNEAHKKLLGIDELNMITRGEHMIINYKDLEVDNGK